MPLFNTRDDNDNRYSSSSPQRKEIIFSSNRHSPPPQSTNDSHSGFFSRRRSTSGSDVSDHGGRRSHGFLGSGRNCLDNDPSIRSARQKVTDAENAEREADRGLNEARQRVKLAQEHVKMLEREALSIAQSVLKRSKQKQRSSARALKASVDMAPDPFLSGMIYFTSSILLGLASFTTCIILLFRCTTPS